MDILITEALKIMPLAQVLVVVLLIWLILTVTKLTSGLELFTRTTMEWRRGHERLDEERHETVMNLLKKES